jgi:ribose 5-phosphate isomerase B
MKIFVGADHNGFHLKADLIAYLTKRGHEVIDEGDKDLKPNDDFPQFASQVVSAVLADDDKQARGVLICGSGQGMAMAANRYKGIRASLVWDVQEAKMSRNDDDSNILCLPARVLSQNSSEAIIDTWLETPFAQAPRFERRIKELDDLG